MADGALTLRERLEHGVARTLPPATLRRFDGLVHGFANMAGVSPACRDAVVEIASMLRGHFDGAANDKTRNGDSP